MVFSGRVGVSVLAAPLALALAGCTYDWNLTPSKDASTDAPAATGGDAGMDGGNDASDAAAVACTSNAGCDASMFCKFADHLCGKGEAGVCTLPRTNACVSVDHLCGCDDHVYGSPCALEAALTDLSTNTVCAPPLNTFKCGYRFCETSSEFCIIKAFDNECAPFGTCSATGKTCQCPTVAQACPPETCTPAPYVTVTCQ